MPFLTGISNQLPWRAQHWKQRQLGRIRKAGTLPAQQGHGSTGRLWSLADWAILIVAVRIASALLPRPLRLVDEPVALPTYGLEIVDPVGAAM